MRTLAKAQINKLKSAYLELNKDILCEIFAAIIYRLSNNGVSVEIPILSQSKIDYLAESGLAKWVDGTSKKPIAGNIKIDFSKHDDEILHEFMRKVMSFKESECDS